eukprot:CAMPEP_0197659396 /NCGR_PEP_ID=MMETSP1338-20131121/47498_1 /TAXON_ID=43686 ORGANISM="Pelagodinium beii, Strain RCC1491" /NCGR_SAMPLE_ID=MMETSP1338 /ASSEMBLY_ACC=CAM_ASM_000754 /LENGTH=256 /DNA_ID=CAMNT_0043236297 /DNA_START=44 /DNA_END=811 /DNA_ORIENTATION=-
MVGLLLVLTVFSILATFGSSLSDELTQEEILAAEFDCAGEGECSLSLRQLRGEVVEQVLETSAEADSELGVSFAEAWKAGVEMDKDEEILEESTNESTEEAADQAQAPMTLYPKKACKHCGEMAFCHRAGNRGCGGTATGGVATFINRAGGRGCFHDPPLLTVPRSYIKDINDLRRKPGAFGTLRAMLTSGYYAYMRTGYTGPVWQCIHPAGSVSVHWLHLHTFCKNGKVDGMPNHHSFCALMHGPGEASSIAAKW